MVTASPGVLDPMYWVGDGGIFGSAVLAGVMIVVFIETGLFFPFLPGDTLLFTAGLIAAQPYAPVDIRIRGPCAALAAFLGSQCGYLAGRQIGPALFRKEDSRIFKRRYLESSHEFFEKHGARTLLIAQFIGVVRTYTPIVAGMSTMRYRVFLAYNLIGSLAWAIGLTVTGYFLGNVRVIGEHLDIMVMVIAALSTVPAAITIGRMFLSRKIIASSRPSEPVT